MNIKKKKVEARKTMVYCGPSIPYIVRRYTSFTNGIIPNELTEIIEKYSVFKELIVSINELADAKRQLRNPHSPMSVYYEKAQSILRTKEVN